MSSTVFSKKINGAATHALVIGVGHYLHLPGGSGKKKFPQPEGMAQLKSPPASARQFARWLVEEYQSPDRPLASVRLLVSEKTKSAFEFSKKNKVTSKSVGAADIASVEKAIRDWHKLGEENPDHLLLFYFCGHGISNGTDLALLTSDFGSEENGPLNCALDFRRFHSAMEECNARRQCYFIDACRVGSTLLDKNQGYAGKPIFNWTGAKPNPGGRMRAGPIFYSTIAGEPAYARPGKASVFTEALLQSLAGAGAGDEDGPWTIKTTNLQAALHFLMLEASRELGISEQQIPNGDHMQQMTINTVKLPSVPVIVRVQPEQAHEEATLRCENEAFKQKRLPNAAPWRLTIPTGTYSFHADFKNAKYKVTTLINETVRPPYWGKPLKVTP
ncbi:MAG: caspase family protein [Arenimonas sp.]